MSAAGTAGRLFLGTHTAGLRRPRTGLVGRYAQEAERRAELDAIRAARRLTDAEQAEHDRLINRLYMREWRKANEASAQVRP